MEYIRCSLCGDDHTELVFKRKDLTYYISDEEFCVVRCRRCGLIYVNPRPTIEELHAYYPEEFYDTQIDAVQLLHDKEPQLLLKYQYIQGLAPGTLLDVGCSKGEFMYFMQQKGWEVHGIDFSSKPPNVFGLDIFYGAWEDAGYAPESFDLVTLWAVLEHVYDPKQVLRNMHRVLKPGGKIIVLVTNFHSLPAWFMRQDDVPRHTTLFTKATLRNMLRCVGFQTDRFSFHCELFGGHNRGVLNYAVKLLAGERIEDIVAQNRSAAHWHQFAAHLRGRPSEWMIKVDKMDIAVMPYLDRWLDRLHCGFIMTATATKL